VSDKIESKKTMGLNVPQRQLTLLLLIALAAAEKTLHGCRSTCGSVSSIPYPFGIGKSSVTGENCFLEKALMLTCINSTLYHGNGNVQILDITLDSKMVVLAFISKVCKNESFGRVETKGNEAGLRTPAFTISSEDNKFVTVGCDTYGYLNSFNNDIRSQMGCLTRCDTIESVQSMQGDGKCTGIGCCQMDIPPGMKNISIQAFSFYNFNDSSDFKCGYSFVAKNGNYTFSMKHLKSVPFDKAPMVIDWAVGKQTCFNSKGKACKSNSVCENSPSGYGYRCKCKKGFEGNPYHPDGCKDIDECKTDNHTCISEQNCVNTIGSHTCFCPKGLSGNGTKEEGCHKRDVVPKVVIGVGAAIVILFVGTTSLYLIYQKRKLVKIREKYFQQNGGSILLQQLSTSENSSRITQIFTEEELKKATNNFDESLIIGSGGFGTVFKGYLADNRVVAVKKSKIVDGSQKEQFINEVIVLSQINHRNVVKLLGCCLEREVPLLVYEFVNNGTLYDFIHTERKVNNETWKTHLRIAAESAGALSYLHSAASIPIIHRDVKTANILLDNTYTAKVSDFGASRLVPIDQTEIATMVQGTFGYLDPEYMRTSQLTEKSDVYSFGVVLVELLTGEKPYSFGKPEEKRSLTNHFLSCLKEDRLSDVVQDGIMNEENKKEIMEVAILAAKCLRLNGEERPSMKEVAMELERMRLTEKHPWINTFQNPEEAQLLQKGSSSLCVSGDSGSHQYTGYDSINDHVQIAFDDGR